MFFNVDKLNEGKGKNSFSHSKKEELSQGKDPKINLNTCSKNWHENNTHCHTNRKWEKLRK
ncbi:hypothetical protein GM418_06665 [Maribellus comscasis]|uniref:Uncharacterized protein n=1 Tax=Maribellus comscasis TaxID=2681766 RepID=A0A6I6JT84_9BACT|nr:hypothetical protein [Maribellus comscasis]QGY43352.1 hypothetical protein GM418_06665 [Maribellus comscasis]